MRIRALKTREFFDEVPLRGAASAAVLAAVALTLGGCLADDVEFEGEIGDGGIDNGDNGAPPTAETYSLSGEALGIGDTPVQLSLSGDETLTVGSDGAFEFDTELEDGDSYSVSISDAPADRQCDLANDEGSISEGDVSDIQLHCANMTARADIMQVHLGWSGPSTMDVFYSTDPECDWDNYASCDNAGIASGLSGHESTLVAVEEDMAVDVPLYFVAESDVVRTEVVGARAAAPHIWATGGPTDFAEDDERLYMGGAFGGVGMFTPGGISVDSESGAPVGSLPRFTAEEFGVPEAGVIAKAEPDGSGGWYVVGQFSEVDGVDRPSIARVNANGSLDETFDPEFAGGEVVDVKRYEDRVYAVGEIQDQGGTLYGLIALDAETGELLSDFTPELDNVATTMTVHDGQLYVGGMFTEINGDTDFQGLAAFDLDSGDVVGGWHPQANGAVWSTTAHGDAIYVGGLFSEIDGEPVHALAAIDADSGALDTDWDAGVNGDVLALENHDGRLYVGGEFDETNQSIGRISLAAFDLEDGSLDGEWAPAALDNFEDPAVIRSLAYHDGRMYVAGNMLLVGDDLALHAGALDPVSGELDADWRPWLSEYEEFGVSQLWTITPAENGQVFIGGLVNGYQDGREHFHLGLAAFDRTTGVVDRDWTSYVIFADADAIEIANDRLYVGGSFDTADGGPFDLSDLLAQTPPGTPRESLAAFSLDDGSLDGWETAGVSQVNALASDDSRLYVGMSDFSYDHLAAFDLASGAELASFSGAGLSSQVHDLLLHDGLLYVAGTFTQDESGNTRNRLAAFEPDTGDLADWNPELDGTARALAHANGNIYVGGDFATAGGEDRDRLAAFSSQDTDAPALRNWDPSADGRVNALVIEGDRVFVGGEFEEIDGSERESLAAVDSSSGALDATWAAEANGTVVGLSIADGMVRVGGGFTQVNDIVRLGMALVDLADGEIVMDEVSALQSQDRAMSAYQQRSLSREGNRLLPSLQDRGDVQRDDAGLLQRFMQEAKEQ